MTVTSAPALPQAIVGPPTTTTTATISFQIDNYRGDTVNYVLSTGGANASDFSVQSHTTTGSCGATSIAATSDASGLPASCTINAVVAFTPTATGTRNGTVHVQLASANSTDVNPAAKDVAISGTASAGTPGISVSPSGGLTLNAVVGSTATQSMTITNPSSATAYLNLAAFNFSSGVFTRDASSTCSTSTSLAPNTSCTLTVAYTPTSPVQTLGSVSITNNTASNPLAVSLTGNGSQAALSLGGTTTLAFGNVPLGSSSSQTVTVTNTGNATLNLSSISVSGTGASGYSLGGTCTGSTALAQNAACSVIVTFTPTTVGTWPAASLSIASNAPGSPATVTLTGAGSALADEQVTPNPLPAFGSTLVGTTNSTTPVVTITNPRANPVTYTATVTGTNAADFVISAQSCSPATIPGSNGTCTLTLQFSPTAGPGAGIRSANLNLVFTGFGADPAPAPVTLALSGTATVPGPIASLSPTTLAFSATVGSSVTQTAVLTNTGNASMTISGLAVSGTNAAEFTLAGGAGACVANQVLAASSACSLVVRYTPMAASNATATLSISDNAPGSPQAVTLSGSPAPQGAISLSTSALSFPDTTVGTSSTQSITVQNTGNAVLTFSGFSLGGAAAGDFSTGGSCSVSSPLASGSLCTLNVSFAPGAAGPRNATLSIQSDASNGASAVVALGGTGLPAPAPVASLSAANLDFGVQTVGGLYPARSLTLTNTGNAPLGSIAVSVSGAGFSNVSAPACPSSLAPGAQCVITLAFAPATAGLAYSGTLSVSSNASGSPLTAALTGSGSAAAVASLIWSPATTQLAFGQVAAGTVSAQQTLSLLNQGPGGVTLSLLNAVGPGAAAFSVTTSNCSIGSVIYQGQSCTVSVSFAPGASGSMSAQVQALSNGNAPPALALSGTGIAGPSPGLALSQASLVFGDTRQGAQSMPARITLTATGIGAVSVASLASSGPFVLANETCPAAPFALQAGVSCTVTVSFAPQAVGAATGAIAIGSDASATPQNVALAGNGVAAADVSSGGCSLTGGNAPTDPTLWALLLLALAALGWRRHAWRGRKARR
ncbi:MAG: choice-of-anchor D domain-containing protein [Burkholderiales bacterium]|nr:choice-of-anchor D domain-containing protein [Burkholderiales bacterium]